MEQVKILAIKKNFPIILSVKTQVFVFTCISLPSLMMPFALGHPQWLVGIIVNACLFLGAVFLPKKYFLPLVVLPSLGVLVRGLVFGPFTYFLIYFLPFIWLGNLVLILGFKTLFLRFGYIFSVLAASAVKFLFLIAAASVYFKMSVIPAVFLQLMGFNQLATALAGGLLSFLIFKFYGRSIS